MYKRITTKKEARLIIDSTLKETEELKNRFVEIGLYEAIYNKILLIKTDVLINKIKMTPFEMIASKKYQLGALVVKNFDLEKEEYAQKLSDIASLPYDYWNMPEE